MVEQTGGHDQDPVVSSMAGGCPEPPAAPASADSGLAALSDAVRLLTGTLNLSEVLQRLTELVRLRLGVDVVRIWLLEGAPREFHLKAQAGVTRQGGEYRMHLGVGEGLVGWIMAHQAPLILPDLQSDPRVQNREWMAAEGLVSFLGVPLVVEGVPVGMLACMSRRRRVFSPEEVALAETLAVPAAIAIRNARLYREASDRAQKLTALSTLTRLMTSATDTRTVFHAVAEAAATLLGAKMAWVFVDDPVGRVLRPQAQYGLGPYLQELTTDLSMVSHGRGVAGGVFQSRAPEYILDVQEDPRWLTPRLAKEAELHACAAIPLITGARVVGVLIILFGDRRRFGPEEKELMNLLADQAAIAIGNAQLYDEAKTRAEQLAILHETARALTAEPLLDVLLQRLTECARDLVGATYGALAVLGNDGRIVQFLTAGVSQEERERIGPLPQGKGLLGTILRTARTVRLEDIAGHPESSGFPPHHPSMRNLLGVPIVVKGKVMGALYLTEKAGGFNRDDEDLVTTLAADAAIAIGNAQMLQELRTGQERLEALFQVSRQFSRIQPTELLLGSIAEACGHLLDSDSVGIRLVEGDELVLLGTWGDARQAMPITRIKIGESLTGIVAATGEPLLVMDPANDPRLIPEHQEAYRRLGVRAFLGVPVKVGERVAGVLSIRTKREQGFSANDLALAMAFASQAAIALENARLVKSLEQAVDDLKAAQDHLVRGETLRAVGELASGMAHHLNNLLAVVLGRTQLLLRKMDDPELRRSLEIVERAALDGAEVVRRVHGFGRMQPVLEAGPVDLNQLAREVLELTRPLWQAQAQVRGIQIEAALEPGQIPSATGDIASLREVFLNLVFNAIDALPSGGRITVKTWVSGLRVHCAVTDTGVGMPEEVEQRAMEPFFTTKGPKSRGLGLSFTYGIIKRHGGEIAIESAPGKGTTVTMSLPFAPVRPPAPVAPEAPASPSRILVIDDEPEVRAMLVEILTAQGHTVSEAANGAEGLSMFRPGEYDLVFTDLAMPGASGWQVAEGIKAISYETPVILVTGWLDQREPASPEARHVDFVLFKPFETEQVATVVSGALAKH